MKIYVDVHTPGNGKKYEFQLDDDMTVEQSKRKMIEEILDVEDGNIALEAEKTILCNMREKKRLNGADTVKSAGIRSGHSLILL